MVWGYANPLIFSSHRFANISHVNYQSQRIRLVTVVSWIQEPRYDGQIGGYSCSDIGRRNRWAQQYASDEGLIINELPELIDSLRIMPMFYASIPLLNPGGGGIFIAKTSIAVLRCCFIKKQMELIKRKW